MKRKSIVRISALAALTTAALVVASVPAEAGWLGDVGFSATFVTPPLVVTVGDRPFVRPWHRPYWHPYCGAAVAPYATPIVVTPPLARVFVRFPYPHWVMRPVAVGRHLPRIY